MQEEFNKMLGSLKSATREAPFPAELVETWVKKNQNINIVEIWNSIGRLETAVDVDSAKAIIAMGLFTLKAMAQQGRFWKETPILIMAVMADLERDGVPREEIFRMFD